MLRTVLMLELRRRLRSPLTWVLFAGLAVYTAATMAGGETEQLAGAGVPHNGAFMLQYWSMYSAFWVAVLGPILFTAPVLRDLRVRIAPLVFATPLSDGDYFWGKYWASLIVCVLVMLSIPLTLLGVSWLHRYGLFGEMLFLAQIPWAQVGQATALWVLPACVVYGSVHHAMSTLSARPLASYAFAVLSMGVFTFFFVAFQADGGHRFWIEVLDPMGKQTVDGQALYWSIADRSTRLLEGRPALVANRLGYLALALTALLIARGRFSLPRFLTAGQRHGARRPPAPVAAGGIQASVPDQPARPGSAVARVPGVSISSWTPWRGLRMAAWLSGWHTAVTWRLTVFRTVVAGLILIGIETGWSAAAELFNGPQGHLLPAAQYLLSVIEPQMFMLIIMVTIYFSADLLDRDRDSRMQALVHSTPLPAGLVETGQWGAVSLLALTLSLLPALATLVLQVGNGYLETHPAHFARSTFIHLGPLALTYGWLTCAVYGFSRNRLVSLGLPMIVLWASVALHEVHAVQQRLWLLGLPADLTFSDFDILSSSTSRHASLGAYFLGVAGLLAALGMWWRLRGQIRLSVRRPPAVAWGALFFALLAAGGGSQVWRQLERHEWAGSAVERDRQSEYERRYAPVMKSQDLRIEALRVDLRLEPARGEVLTESTWQVVNEARQPLTSLYSSLPEDSRVEQLSLNGTTLALRMEDELLRVVRYDLLEPLPPGATASIALRMQTDSDGYTYDPPENRIERGATFVDERNLPVLGYDRTRELVLNTERRQRGLPPRQPLSHRPDRFASNAAAGRVDVELHIRAPRDYRVNASGQRVGERCDPVACQIDFRLHDAPLHWLVTAARAQTSLASHESGKARGHRAVEVQYLDGHGPNAARMLSTINDVLTAFEARFGVYPQPVLDVVETAQFPQDEDDGEPLVQSAGGLTVLPERVGWLHDYRREPAYDLLTFNLSRELARGWWGGTLGAAAVPGAALLDEGVPGLLALEMLARRHGEQAADSYAAMLRESYLKRSALTEGEVPGVLQTDSQRYAGLQATLVLYAQRKRLGVAAFDMRLDEFFRARAEPAAGRPVEPLDLAHALGMDTRPEYLHLGVTQ